MEVVSVCPIRVAELSWLLPNGAPAITVVCKATFNLQPGEATLAQQQDPPAADDAYWTADIDKPPSGFTDLVPFKPRADVVIVGHAHAPPQRPARTLLVRAIVGAMDKAIEVFPDRFLMPNGEVREGQPWMKQRLAWERAAGGPETGNPIGMRFDTQDGLGATAIPNLQPPGVHFARRGDTFGPACFAPVPPAWPSRVYKLYRHGRTFIARDWSTRPIPEDIDRGFFNMAPPDQQPQELRADERIVLDHLHPEHPRLVTRLPGIEPTATVVRSGRMPSHLALTLDTLWIDTDRATCSLVWRGTIPLAHAGESGQVSISMEGGVPPTQSAQGIQNTQSNPSPRARPQTLHRIETGVPAEALPFARSGEARDAGAAPGGAAPGAAASDAALPFRTGAHALRDLSASVITTSPIPSSRAAPPTFAPPPRPSEGGSPSGMPPRAMTLEISPPTPGSPGLSLGPPAPPSPPAPPPQQAPPAPPLASMMPVPPPPPPVAPGPMQPPAIVPPRPVGIPSQGPVAPEPPAPTAGLGASGSWSLGAADRRPPQGSIGERMATEQAMIESKLALEKRGSDEPERIGPLAKTPPPVPESPSPAPPRDASPRRTPANAARPEGREAVLLLWLDSTAVPRMRKKPAFRELLDALEEREPDAELDASVDGALADVDDQRAVFEILARGQTTDDEGLQKAMIDGLREDGKFVPPMALLAGELAFPFDELETLRATVITVAPLAGADEQLKSALENAREFLKTPDLACSPAVAEGMIQRIRDAFSQGKRVVPAGYLESQAERTLLEQRHYQKRNVFGGAQLRAFLHLPGSSAPVPAYLPAQVASKLPLFQKFRARLVVTAHLAEDQNETHPTALKVLAFARIAPAPGAAPPKK